MKPIRESSNNDLIASLPAMRRAARIARYIAMRTNTAIVILKDHKIVRITAAELRAQRRNI